MAMGIAPVEWHGTNEERDLFLSALSNNCGCVFYETVLTERCRAHEMLVTDQRALDGLLFMRHLAAQLDREEWDDGTLRTG